MFFRHDVDDRSPSDDDKTVTFFNIPTESLVRYSGKILEPPISLPIQLVKTGEGDGCIRTSVIEATTEEKEDKKGTDHRHSNISSLGFTAGENSQSYAAILARSCTFVIPDSYFFSESILVDSDGFLDHGLEPLKQFYETGGTVLVMCVEGIYSIGSLLQSAFGCDWKLGLIDNEFCTPTARGREYFGAQFVVEKLYASKGHFMKAPRDEGLYQAQVLDFERYKHEYYGLGSGDDDDDDEEYSDGELECCQKSYDNYVRENNGNFLLALHENNDGGGRVMWMGDRNEADPKMRRLFAKLGMPPGEGGA